MDNIKEIVKAVIGKLSREPNIEVKIEQVWKEFVGDKYKEHAQLTGIKNSAVFVTVDSPARLHQFKSKKSALLRAFKEVAPEINDIIYRVGQM